MKKSTFINELKDEYLTLRYYQEDKSLIEDDIFYLQFKNNDNDFKEDIDELQYKLYRVNTIIDTTKENIITLLSIIKSI